MGTVPLLLSLYNFLRFEKLIGVLYALSKTSLEGQNKQETLFAIQ